MHVGKRADGHQEEPGNTNSHFTQHIQCLHVHADVCVTSVPCVQCDMQNTVSSSILAVCGSPGDGRHTGTVLIDEVAPCVEHPAVVEGHEGMPGCGGRVLTVLTVCVL